ncbi:N-formylglutamate amidohydrolase [Alphaproteobacteria bacterium KMM 3653]|uniref:N-formylglutamate amidohydrolase n=1 Tax=Harenicola maris TaxID=2841044 RepID=A0AAP2CP75_9RHOB|nr:N-formylglutamate amidohydrolase [Harenicola maris]
MTDQTTEIQDQSVETVNPQGGSRVVLVCEHASAFIPASFANLGLDAAAAQSHIAWDPGARAVALRMSERLDAPLVAGKVSRLVYDCNRPPEAPDAMPARSEIFEVPGNAQLTEAERSARTARYYMPFRAALAQRVKSTVSAVIVTVHSFTPVYNGQDRAVEIGVLHDADTRLADALLSSAAQHTDMQVMRNEPYGPQHGVTHTLTEHALPGGHLNVMLEIRNDLIATTAQQEAMGDMIAAWLAQALTATDDAGNGGALPCSA